MNPLLYKMAKAEMEMEENFLGDNGKFYLVRCPKCKRENWSGAVSSGVCAWCGFDANIKEFSKDHLKRMGVTMSKGGKDDNGRAD